MTREGIKDIINNSYKYSSEGFLIDVDLASERIVKYFDQETQRLKDELAEKDNLIHSLEQQLEERNIGIQALEQHEEIINRMAARMQEMDKEHQSELTAQKELNKTLLESASFVNNALVESQSELTELKGKHKILFKKILDVSSQNRTDEYKFHVAVNLAEQMSDHYNETHKTK